MSDGSARSASVPLLLAAAALACLSLAPPRCAEGASFYGLIRKGNRFFKNELYKEALGYYLRGGEKNRRAIEPPFNAGASLYKMEDFVRSAEILARALESAKKPETRSNILYNMGNCSFRLGDYGKAAELYRKGLELTPYDLNLKYNLELALKKMERKEKEEQRGGGMRRPPEGGEGAAPDRQKGEPQGAGSRGAGKSAEAGPGTEKREKDAPFSREEAERLLRSVNPDQSKIVGDYIRQKLGMAENEKDW